MIRAVKITSNHIRRLFICSSRLIPFSSCAERSAKMFLLPLVSANCLKGLNLCSLIISRLFIIKARGLERCYYEFLFNQIWKFLLILWNWFFRAPALHSAQSCCKAGRFWLRHDKNNFCFRFAARETNDASKQNYNAVEETLHVKWKFMLKLRVYACILAILLAVANDFINFVCCVPKGGSKLERKWSNLRCVISAPRVNFVRETSFHVRLSHSSSV